MEECEDWCTSEIEDDVHRATTTRHHNQLATAQGSRQRAYDDDDDVGGKWMGGMRMDLVDGACAATEDDEMYGDCNDDDSAEFLELWSGEVQNHYK